MHHGIAKYQDGTCLQNLQRTIIQGHYIPIVQKALEHTLVCRHLYSSKTFQTTGNVKFCKTMPFFMVLHFVNRKSQGLGAKHHCGRGPFLQIIVKRLQLKSSLVYEYMSVVIAKGIQSAIPLSAGRALSCGQPKGILADQIPFIVIALTYIINNLITCSTLCLSCCISTITSCIYCKSE